MCKTVRVTVDESQARALLVHAWNRCPTDAGVQKPVAEPQADPSSEAACMPDQDSKQINAKSRDQPNSRIDQDGQEGHGSPEDLGPAEHAATIAGDSASMKPGQRIRVYWPDDNAWYKGTVKKHNKTITTGPARPLPTLDFWMQSNCLWWGRGVCVRVYD